MFRGGGQGQAINPGCAPVYQFKRLLEGGQGQT